MICFKNDNNYVHLKAVSMSDNSRYNRGGKITNITMSFLQLRAINLVSNVNYCYLIRNKFFGHCWSNCGKCYLSFNLNFSNMKMVFTALIILIVLIYVFNLHVYFSRNLLVWVFDSSIRQPLVDLHLQTVNQVRQKVLPLIKLVVLDSLMKRTRPTKCVARS